MIELYGDLDVWITDDTNPLDSEEVYQLRGLLKSPNRQRVSDPAHVGVRPPLTSELST